ncbi:Arylesterase [Roseovarius indicus]|uniref:Arylesterase n=1 Tax=Roseovarius indicus TaxID=540747 RepID=A0A5P3AAP5_9RHOB|nr:Arylesterase [Roseovarius indicus]SFD88941.1 Pimeloyl-ACP methyl ester carboxylesterase [Roseovarius indicus]
MLGFLAATGRPHRRERLCELLWDVPDDPKAALRWSLTKLRKVVDTPEDIQIRADRERVWFDANNAQIDLHDITTRLKSDDVSLSVDELEHMADRLDMPLLDGLDEAGDEAFTGWLTSEREDASALRVEVLQRLATHPEMPAFKAGKWRRLWHEVDPEGASAHEEDQGATTKNAGPPPRTTRKSNPGRRAVQAQRIGFCDVPDGTKIAYATIGSGPPMLKAANWLNHLEFDWNSPIWGRTFGTIARARTFIRYDERGSGLSDWDVDKLEFDAFVEDLEAVADSLGLERFPLLGISQGCAVSIEYAARHPERVSGLILFGGYAAGWRHLSSPEEQARREAVLTLTEVGWGTDNPAYRHIFSQTFMPDASAEDLAWFDDFQHKTASPRNAARFQEAFGWIDVRHRLKDVRVPTIVLHSQYDQRIPLDMGRALASGIPGARFVPLQSRNHIIVDKEPAWHVGIRAVADFLREHEI